VNHSIAVTENAFTRLNADWRAQCANEANACVVAGWLTEAGVFQVGEAPQDLADLLEVLAVKDRRGGRAHSDLWLAELVRRSGGQGEEARLACRVVIQAMLPAAMNITRRMRRHGRGFGDAAHAVIGALYEVVAAYPLRRRPRRIAANLAMDTLQRATRELASDCSREEEVPLELAGRCDPPVAPVDPAELAVLADIAARAATAGLWAADEELTSPRVEVAEVAELLVWALREQVLEPIAARTLAAHHRVDPVPDEVLALEAGVSPSTVRQWRCRARQRLREAAPRYIAAAA